MQGKHRSGLWFVFATVMSIAGLLQPTSSTRAENFALLIGVDRYPNDTDLKQLDAAEKDAEALFEALRKQEFTCIILTTRRGANDERLNPTRANIQYHLDRLLGRYDEVSKRNVPVDGGIDLKRLNTVIVAFSGHGVILENDPKNYICPTDAIADPRHSGTLVALEDIVRQMEGSAAQNRFLLVDACRETRKANAGKKGIGDSLNVKKTTGVLLSCESGQLSWELKDQSHGLFFHYVLEALSTTKAVDSATGAVSWDSLRTFVKSAVPKRAMAERGRRQNPTDIGNGPSPSPILVRPTEPASLPPSFSDDAARDAQREWSKVLGINDRETLRLSDQGSIQIVLIPPGKFVCGSPKDEISRELSDDGVPRDETQHAAVITRPFFIAECETTQEQFNRIMRRKPSFFQLDQPGARFLRANNISSTKDLPVERVSWDDAKEFCRKINSLLQQEDRWRGYECRLPYEHEWEYACRAGTTTPFYFGPRCNNNLLSNCDLRIAYPPGPGVVEVPDRWMKCPTDRQSSKENAFGLRHMHGNVAEWCEDYYADYNGDVTDSTGPKSGSERVVRGGAWNRQAGECRSASRSSSPADRESNSIGFRIVIAKTEK